MRYVITKLFHTNPDGETGPGTVVLHREGRRMRKVSGHIGGKSSDGHHVTELRGSDRTVSIEMDAGTTLHIQPAE